MVDARHLYTRARCDEIVEMGNVDWTSGEIRENYAVGDRARAAADQEKATIGLDPVRAQRVESLQQPTDAGASARVLFEVPVDLLSFTGVDYRRIVEPGIVEPGIVEVMIGASSADIRLRAHVDLVGDVCAPGEHRRLASTVRIAAVSAVSAVSAVR